jgi:hypothetical protein
VAFIHRFGASLNAHEKPEQDKPPSLVEGHGVARARGIKTGPPQPVLMPQAIPQATLE